jgi:hypothetical protein
MGFNSGLKVLNFAAKKQAKRFRKESTKSVTSTQSTIFNLFYYYFFLNIKFIPDVAQHSRDYRQCFGEIKHSIKMK